MSDEGSLRSPHRQCGIPDLRLGLGGFFLGAFFINCSHRLLERRPERFPKVSSESRPAAGEEESYESEKYDAHHFALRGAQGSRCRLDDGIDGFLFLDLGFGEFPLLGHLGIYLARYIDFRLKSLTLAAAGLSHYVPSGINAPGISILSLLPIGLRLFGELDVMIVIISRLLGPVLDEISLESLAYGIGQLVGECPVVGHHRY